MKFLQNPRLASSPLSTKKAFLKSKGLSDEQINEACAKAGVSSTPQIPPHANYPLIVQNPQTTWLVKLRDAANVLVICGGLAGAPTSLQVARRARWDAVANEAAENVEHRCPSH